MMPQQQYMQQPMVAPFYMFHIRNMALHGADTHTAPCETEEQAFMLARATLTDTDKFALYWPAHKTIYFKTFSNPSTIHSAEAKCEGAILFFLGQCS